MPAADRRRVRTAFAFLAPSLIGVLLFLVIPVIFVIVLSLTQWNRLPGHPRHRRRVTEITSDLGPAWLGTEPVSTALRTAQTDANYVLRTS